MSGLTPWKIVEERIAAACRRGQHPNPEDLRLREKYEKEWELSYPIAAGWYSPSDEGVR